MLLSPGRAYSRSICVTLSLQTLKTRGCARHANTLIVAATRLPTSNIDTSAFHHRQQRWWQTDQSRRTVVFEEWACRGLKMIQHYDDERVYIALCVGYPERSENRRPASIGDGIRAAATSKRGVSRVLRQIRPARWSWLEDFIYRMPMTGSDDSGEHHHAKSPQQINARCPQPRSLPPPLPSPPFLPAPQALSSPLHLSSMHQLERPTVSLCHQILSVRLLNLIAGEALDFDTATYPVR
jgi:hypothetical protein